jgi:hypothetical protein
MRKSTRGRWVSRLTSAALALMGLGLAASSVMTAQDFGWY